MTDLTVLFASAGVLPVPSAAPIAAQLTAFAKWEGGKYTPQFATVSIDSSGTGSISAGATLYGWDVVDSAWRAISQLNGGNAISLTAVIGFEGRLNDVGLFGALAVSGTVNGGITVTVKFHPVSSTE
ncbi:hypothetical protein LCGC14_1271190 [marine sediment metagenome]|uniref:Uncharacterized protein n=2 Tax=marine sediment metagenome TaxID=412755 RepID=A0A0F9LJ23_9ZZZZ